MENHSAYVQQLAWMVFCLINPGEKVTEEILKSALCNLLDSNELIFMQQIEPLTTYQMNFLKAIGDGIRKDFGDRDIREGYDLGSNSNITRLKTAMLARDIIDTDGAGFYFTDPLFKQWWKRKQFR